MTISYSIQIQIQMSVVVPSFDYSIVSYNMMLECLLPGSFLPVVR